MLWNMFQCIQNDDNNHAKIFYVHETNILPSYHAGITEADQIACSSSNAIETVDQSYQKKLIRDVRLIVQCFISFTELECLPQNIVMQEAVYTR